MMISSVLAGCNTDCTSHWCTHCQQIHCLWDCFAIPLISVLFRCITVHRLPSFKASHLKLSSVSALYLISPHIFLTLLLLCFICIVESQQGLQTCWQQNYHSFTLVWIFDLTPKKVSDEKQKAKNFQRINVFLVTESVPLPSSLDSIKRTSH